MNERPKIAVDFGRSAVARYIQLATLFRRRIQTGQWPIGRQVPTVDDLAKEFGVARATIRQALGELEAERLIERFRAKGTFVRSRPQEPLLIVGTDLAGLLRPNHDAEIEIIAQEMRVKPDRIAEPIGTLAAAYRHVQRRHWRDGKPFLLTHLYINEELMKQIKKKDLQTKTALRLIIDLPGFTVADVRQTVTIGAADAEVAEALSIPLNAPVAFVNRRAVGEDGVLALAAEGIYRGDVVRFDFKLK